MEEKGATRFGSRYHLHVGTGSHQIIFITVRAIRFREARQGLRRADRVVPACAPVEILTYVTGIILGRSDEAREPRM